MVHAHAMVKVLVGRLLSCVCREVLVKEVFQSAFMPFLCIM